MHPTDTSVSSLFAAKRLSSRLRTALTENGFTDLKEFALYDLSRIRLLRGFGPATTEELLQLLTELFGNNADTY